MRRWPCSRTTPATCDDATRRAHDHGTGIGAAGTFLVGIWFFGDVASLGRYLGVILIIMGVAALKLAP